MQGSMDNDDRYQVTYTKYSVLSKSPLTVLPQRHANDSPDTIRLAPQQPPTFPHPILHRDQDQPSYHAATRPASNNPDTAHQWYPSAPPSNHNHERAHVLNPTSLTTNTNTFNLSNIDPRLLNDTPSTVVAPVQQANSATPLPPAVHFSTSTPAQAQLPTAHHCNPVPRLPPTGHFSIHAPLPVPVVQSTPATTATSIPPKRKPGRPKKKPLLQPLLPSPSLLNEVNADTALHSHPVNIKQEPLPSTSLPSTDRSKHNSLLESPPQQITVPRRSSRKPKQNLRTYLDVDIKPTVRSRRQPRQPQRQSDTSPHDSDLPRGVERESESETEAHDWRRCPLKVPKHYRKPDVGSSWDVGESARVDEGRVLTLRERLVEAGIFG